MRTLYVAFSTSILFQLHHFTSIQARWSEVCSSSERIDGKLAELWRWPKRLCPRPHAVNWFQIMFMALDRLLWIFPSLLDVDADRLTVLSLCYSWQTPTRMSPRGRNAPPPLRERKDNRECNLLLVVWVADLPRVKRKWCYKVRELTALVVVVLVAEAEFLFLARSLDMAFSAVSARSSASSNSCCTLRYLARLIAAISSCVSIIGITPIYPSRPNITRKYKYT